MTADGSDHVGKPTQSYIPFGVNELDRDHEGIPNGSAVLLAGASDAGIHAFTYTSLANLMLAKHRPETLDQSFGDRATQIPESVTYLTLSHDREHVLSELAAVLSTEQYDVLTDHLTIIDLSQRFMSLLPVPPALFNERRGDTEHVEAVSNIDEFEQEDQHSFEQFLDEMGGRLADAADDLLVLDSFSDIRRATKFGLPAGHDIGFLFGIRDAVVNWDTVAYVMYDRQASQVREDASIHGISHGSIYFYSNDQGVATYRTLRVGSFGGALDTERQTVYEGIVGDHGYRAKGTKKIRPSNW